jgi:hypothetical protein
MHISIAVVIDDFGKSYFYAQESLLFALSRVPVHRHKPEKPPELVAITELESLPTAFP